MPRMLEELTPAEAKVVELMTTEKFAHITALWVGENLVKDGIITVSMSIQVHPAFGGDWREGEYWLYQDSLDVVPSGNGVMLYASRERPPLKLGYVADK